ncbi:30S ribosomal protein S15 [Candidatus Pacearchaeota archaeon]|nr:30S ribosomal protein S15 [Candidatus Pacearchaeota archaeon]
MNSRKINSMENPLWLKRSKEEVESLVVKFAQEGISSEKIGLILRDTYGIPTTKIIAGKITEILAKHNIKQESADLLNLKKKAEKLKSHMEKNKQDKVAKRGFQITHAKITTVEKYYKNRAK